MENEVLRKKYTRLAQELVVKYPNLFVVCLDECLEAIVEQYGSVSVTIDYLEGTSFLLCRSYHRMFPLGLCQYLEDRYVFSLGPQHFSLTPFPQDAPTPVPLLIFPS